MLPGFRFLRPARLAVLLLATAAPALRAQESPDVATRLAAYMDAQATVKGFNGAVLVEQDGKPLLRQAYGQASIELGVPNTPETRFRLGSITKSFTAMAIMVLQEQGKLSVNDLVSKHVPDAPEAWKDVTIHHLLTHTSGIPSFTSFPDYNARKREPSTPDQLLARFRDKPLDFAPGTKHDYSNSGYVLLGYIIEKASGQTYEAFLKSAVLDPLGLADTGYDHAEALIPRRASGYGMGPDGATVNADYLDMSIPFAAGALYSTVDDLARWAHAFDTQALVSKEAHAAILTPALDNYAYGWIVNQRDGRTIIGHGGGIDGFVTNLTRCPEQKLVIAVLSNKESSNPGALTADLARIVFGEPYELPRNRAEIAVAPEVLDRYLGTYQLAPGLAFTVTREGDHLVGKPEGQRPAPLYAESETVFYPKVVDATLEFVVEGDGPASAVILRQGGNEMKGPRVAEPAATGDDPR